MKYPSKSELKEFEADFAHLSLRQKLYLAESAINTLGKDLKFLHERLDSLQYLWQCWDILYKGYQLEEMKELGKIKKIPMLKSGLSLESLNLSGKDRRFLMDRLSLILEERETATEKQERKKGSEY